MLNFIVPLKSPEVSRDWEVTSRLCNRTLYSICRQTCPRFRVVLVCNERPVNCYQHENLEVIEGSFPVPDEELGNMDDKFRKLRRGALRLKGIMRNEEYFMAVDADDLVHRGLAKKVNSDACENGWYFPYGYIYPNNSYFVFVKNEFYKYCGTSSVVKCYIEDMPNSEKDSGSFYPGGHSNIVKRYNDAERPLKSIDFIGACYTVDSGENHSGVSWRGWHGKKRFIEKMLNMRPIIWNQISHKFGMGYSE